MKETKPNILKAALQLFNQNGFSSVRLQHIADEANVSIGNLAYHFATKKDLLANIYQDLVLKQVELINELNIVPLFENLDRHWDNVFQIQYEYAFFYQDTLEILRYSNEIFLKCQEHTKWEKDQLFRILQFNISRGALIPLEDDVISQVADLTWLIENSWSQRMTMAENSSLSSEKFKILMWQLILPYLSDIGKQEYDQLIKWKAIPL
ncbi:MAG: TetR/AcrR family transcriptional regulator [Cytophagales bacterium]|nr:TetR/AcrR family transcriptional regulator [Cytophagales bacterium]